MRLKSIHIAGFKSFPSPVSVPFPGQFCAVVGPNGSGKSNIVDAVRWVLGELSSQQLRGRSMADVIFNGAAQSKPLGRASVELLLDNAAASLAGRYAGASEVSVRRAVSRDGESEYRINGVACRRRDVLDLFRDGGMAGTVYAVIGQDMIGSLIKAKSDGLRRYLEAAAGMAQYHARRAETERRMRDARENIARLGDIRSELERQLRQLRRQASMAKRYASLKDAERTLSAELDALSWQNLNSELDAERAELAEREAGMQRLAAEREAADRSVRQLRQRGGEEAARREREQARFVELEMALHSAEQGLKVARQRERDIDENLGIATRSMEAATAQLTQDRGELASCRGETESMKGRHDELATAVEQATSRRAEAERALQEWQQRWDQVGETHSAGMEAVQGRIREAAARCAVLEAWLADAEQGEDPEVAAFMARHGLDEERRAAARIVVHEGWEAAVDTALSGFVRAALVDGIDAMRPALGDLRSGALALLEDPGAERVVDRGHPLRRAGAVALIDKVSAPEPLRALLSGCYGADSLEQALAWRGMLAPGESLLSRDGSWCGPHWLRVAIGDSQVGPLRRRSELAQAQERRAGAEAELRELQGQRQRQRERLSGERDAHQAALATARQRSDAAKTALHDFSSRQHALLVKAQGIEQGIARADQQLGAARTQRERWERAQAENRERARQAEGQMAPLRARRAAAEEQLGTLRADALAQERALSDGERGLAALDRTLNEAREPVQQLRLREQRLLSEMEHLNTRVAASGHALDELVERIAKAEAPPSAESLRARLERASAQLKRIGQVNLAAVEDFAARSERKEGLDAQDRELRAALEQLAEAIQRLDRETKGQLRDVIDAVNAQLQDLFSLLFSGGKAALHVGDGDVLDAELSLRAGPPGKRVGDISSLSGGEQALTATALLFALFSVNQAPFCFLDEADAALDDVNVARFADLVSTMSQRVQIICVTHNRATMQKADQLIGVAMREPGASQVIGVDLEEAVELAGRA